MGLEAMSDDELWRATVAAWDPRCRSLADARRVNDLGAEWQRRGKLGRWSEACSAARAEQREKDRRNREGATPCS